VRILIAEDDDTSRLVLARTLEKLGYGVTESRDGAEAWALFQQEQPRVVITDWMMPGVDGLELCRRIRGDAANDGYTYLMVLTALGGKQNYLEAMDAGADDFLTKPFDADELVARLRVAERILGTETTLRYFAALHRCCPGCQRVRQTDGRWAGLKQIAASLAGCDGAPARCPDCQRRQHTAPVGRDAEIEQLTLTEGGHGASAGR
jgi:DNA-binding response OmpR family regulator